MPPVAKVITTGRSQVVLLPKEFRISTDEVFVRRAGANVILTPKPKPRSWRAYFRSAPVASAEFMVGVEDS